MSSNGARPDFFPKRPRRPIRSRIFHTGGRYDAVTDSWVPTLDTNAPEARGPGVWTGSELVVWGGRAATCAKFCLRQPSVRRMISGARRNHDPTGQATALGARYPEGDAEASVAGHRDAIAILILASGS